MYGKMIISTHYTTITNNSGLYWLGRIPEKKKENIDIIRLHIWDMCAANEEIAVYELGEVAKDRPDHSPPEMVKFWSV